MIRCARSSLLPSSPLAPAAGERVRERGRAITGLESRLREPVAPAREDRSAFLASASGSLHALSMRSSHRRPGLAPLEPLEVLGVDAFDDSQVTIKIRIKTVPLKQWEVGRELRRRIKKAFDARGIEIPFPHMSIYFGEASRPFAVTHANGTRVSKPEAAR